MGKKLGHYFKSAVCTAWFRIRGVKSGLISCEGRLPVLYTTGSVEVGTYFAIRNRIARSEFGASEPNSRLKFGDRVAIGQGVSIVATSYIEVGSGSMIGDLSSVLDTNWHAIDPDHPTRSAPVIIGEDVWLGRGVLVMPGSKIGDHTVVAAGSVVKGDIPPSVLVSGNPAQVVRELKIPDGWGRNLNL